MKNGNEPSPTPRYNQLLAAAIGIAHEMQHSYVGAEHLFLAIIRDREAVPTQVLGNMVNLDQVETDLRGVLGSTAYLMPEEDDERPSL